MYIMAYKANNTLLYYVVRAYRKKQIKQIIFIQL